MAIIIMYVKDDLIPYIYWWCKTNGELEDLEGYVWIP